MSGMKVKELMDSLKGDGYRFRVHYPEEWEFGLITGATFFGKRGLVLQHGEDDVSSFTLKSRDDDCNGFAYLPAPAAKKSREGHPKIDDSHDGECARSGSYRRGGEFDECFQVPSSIRPLSAFFAWHFS